MKNFKFIVAIIISALILGCALLLPVVLIHYGIFLVIGKKISLLGIFILYVAALLIKEAFKLTDLEK